MSSNHMRCCSARRQAQAASQLQVFCSKFLNLGLFFIFCCFSLIMMMSLPSSKADIVQRRTYLLRFDIWLQLEMMRLHILKTTVKITGSVTFSCDFLVIDSSSSATAKRHWATWTISSVSVQAASTRACHLSAAEARMWRRRWWNEWQAVPMLRSGFEYLFQRVSDRELISNLIIWSRHCSDFVTIEWSFCVIISGFDSFVRRHHAFANSFTFHRTRLLRAQRLLRSDESRQKTLPVVSLRQLHRQCHARRRQWQPYHSWSWILVRVVIVFSSGEWKRWRQDADDADDDHESKWTGNHDDDDAVGVVVDSYDDGRRRCFSLYWLMDETKERYEQKKTIEKLNINQALIMVIYDWRAQSTKKFFLAW